MGMAQQGTDPSKQTLEDKNAKLGKSGKGKDMGPGRVKKGKQQQYLDLDLFNTSEIECHGEGDCV